MAIVAYIFILVLIFILALPWLFILAAPLVAAGVSILVGARLLIGEILNFIFQKVIQHKLSDFLLLKAAGLQEPVKVCACMSQRGHQTFISTQFVTKNGSWSHQLKATSLQGAIERLNFQVERREIEMSINQFRNFKPCANFAHCPNRTNKNPAKLLFLHKFNEARLKIIATDYTKSTGLISAARKS